MVGSPIIELAAPVNTDDLEFLSIGGDSASIGIKNNELPVGLPAGTNARFSREWQVQKAGDVGTVNISWDLSEHSVGANYMSKVRLLIDTDADFSAGASILSTAPTIIGTTITFSGVPLADGDYITVALPYNAVAPGGVVNGLKVWTRADRGIFTDVLGTTVATNGQDVNLVKDQSNNGNNFTDHPSGGAPKLFIEPTLGYQNTLQFCRQTDTGAAGYLGTQFGQTALGTNCTADNDYLYDTNGALGSSTYTDGSIYTVAMDQYISTNDGVYGESPSFETYQKMTNGNQYARLGNNGTNELQSNYNATLNSTDHTYNIFSMIGSTTNDGDGTIGQRTKKNGRALSTDASFTSFAGNNSPAYLGAVSGGNDRLHGRIGEVISYAQNSVQTPLETQRIESYLALKYGITLSNIDTLAGINE